MVQFRFTNQFAKNLKISLSNSPEPTCYPLDDWIGDVFHVGRKKVAILTHAHTFISFIFPYAEVAGASNVLAILPVELEDYLRAHGFEEHIALMVEIFSHPHTFTKTSNRKALGHMNEFKKIVEYLMHRNNAQVNWHDISDVLNDTIITIGRSSYQTPKELLKDFLKNYFINR
jgi:hypothetical protein